MQLTKTGRLRQTISRTVDGGRHDPLLEGHGFKAKRWRGILRQGALVIILIALVLTSVSLYPGFLDPRNLANLLSQNAPLGVVAVAMTLVMITRGFDLSVGAMYATGATVYASLAFWGWSLPAAAAATVFVGLIGGAGNAVLITKLNVNAFVTTLGTTSVFSGLALIYSKSSPFVVNNPAFTVLGRGSLFGVPCSILILLLCFIAGQFVLVKTVYGRSLYAIGGNDEAARLAGIRVALLRGSTYVICSASAAVAGMIMASRVSIGQADIGGSIALDAIAVVVIGGTSLQGGAGAVWRTGVGLLIVSTLSNLLDSLAVDANYQLLIKGAIVVGAVALDAITHRRS